MILLTKLQMRQKRVFFEYFSMTVQSETISTPHLYAVLLCNTYRASVRPAQR